MENKIIQKYIICGALVPIASTELNPFCDKCSEHKHYHKPENKCDIGSSDRNFSAYTTTLSASVSGITSTTITQSFYN